MVSGGTGGVGSMVVQMARASGAYVFAIIGNKAKVALRRSPHSLINYRSENIVEQYQLCLRGLQYSEPKIKGVDIWYETQPPTDLERTFNCMTPGGRVNIRHGGPSRREAGLAERARSTRAICNSSASPCSTSQRRFSGKPPRT